MKQAIKRNAMDTATLHHNQEEMLSIMNVTHNILRTLANHSEIQYEQVERMWDRVNMLLDKTNSIKKLEEFERKAMQHI